MTDITFDPVLPQTAEPVEGDETIIHTVPATEEVPFVA